MPKGEQGFPPPGGKKYKPIQLEHDARDSLAEALAAGTDEAAEQRIADEIDRDEAVVARSRAQQAREFREIRSARRATTSGKLERDRAAAEQEDAFRNSVSKNLDVAKEKLARASSSRKADKEYIAARRERIEELRQESVAAMKAPKTGDRKRPRHFMEEIAAIEAEIHAVEERMRERVPSSVVRRRAEEVDIDAPENGPEPSPTAPEEPSAQIAEAVVVPDMKTEAVRAGAHATDPLKTPETPKEMQASLAEAARIFQSGEGYIDADELQRKAKERAIASASEEAARIFQSGGEGYIDVNSAKQVSSEKTVLSAEVPEASAKPSRDPYMAEDMVVMANSVLTKQALGGNKKAIDRFVKKHSPNAFPADPTYAGTPEARAVRAKKEERQKSEGRKKWFGRSGVLAVAGILAFLGLNNGKKEEAVEMGAGKRPVAAKSAADAGLTLPNLDQSTVTIPNTLSEGVPQSLSEWAGGSSKAEEKKPAEAKKAQPAAKKPPRVAVPAAKAERPAPAAPEQLQAQAKTTYAFPWDTRFNPWEKKEGGRLRSESPAEHLERMARETGYSTPYRIDGNSNENLSESSARPPASTAPAVASPEAPPAEAAVAPAAIPESAPTSTPQLFKFQEGKQFVLLVAGGEGNAAFKAAQNYAKTLPEGQIVRFEAVAEDGSPLRGAFFSRGEGKLPSPLLTDPVTKQDFAAPDASKLRNPLAVKLETGSSGG